MDKEVNQYILSQSAEWQVIMTDIHSIIVEEDKTVVPIVESMMGKEMIIYKAKGFMKYALAGVKNYMSLHVLPIYASESLHTKFKALLLNAKFQKGCINFHTAGEMPLDIVRQLFADCSLIDLAKIREDYMKEKKLKSRVKK